ncbi:metallophosphatase domain-containing protein [Nannocystaceae bacterium ST9]
MSSLRIVIVSDTHGFDDQLDLPEGDVLVHAGDGCKRGTLDEAHAWMDALRRQPHAHKLVIAGNHDRCFETAPFAARPLTEGLTYLQDSGTTIAGLRFWGAPWQPWFLSWAFNLQRGPEIAAKWALIPAGIDVLITHGPPAGVLDRTWDDRPVGCADLLAAVERVGPRLHAFGHIHESHGTLARAATLFVNASVCTLAYQPTQSPIVVDLPLDRSKPASVIEIGSRVREG